MQLSGNQCLCSIGCRFWLPERDRESDREREREREREKYQHYRKAQEARKVNTDTSSEAGVPESGCSDQETCGRRPETGLEGFHTLARRARISQKRIGHEGHGEE